MDITDRANGIAVGSVLLPQEQFEQHAEYCQLVLTYWTHQYRYIEAKGEWSAWCDANQWDMSVRPSVLLKKLLALSEEKVAMMSSLTEAIHDRITRLKAGERLYLNFQKNRMPFQKSEVGFRRAQSNPVFSLILEQGLQPKDYQELSELLLKKHQLAQKESAKNSHLSLDHSQSMQMLKAELHKYKINLRWPEPPYNIDFFEILSAELEFQTSWMIQIYELAMQLSPSESDNVPIPETPFTEDSVTAYLAKHREVVAERGFFHFLDRPQVVPELEAVLNRVKEIKAKGWTEILEQQYLQSTKQCAIPSGTFEMGANPNDDYAFKNERPQHSVEIPHGLMAFSNPVTEGTLSRMLPKRFKLNTLLPAVNLSWFDAVELCNILSTLSYLEPAYLIQGASIEWRQSANGWRLPTEAEWEYIARAGEKYRFSGHRDASEVAWFRDNGLSIDARQSVQQKAPNAWGLFDMSGNVWEWCWDSGVRNYAERPTSFQSAHHNPLFFRKEDNQRVCRGGCYDSSIRQVRVSRRMLFGGTFTADFIGFRPVRTVH